MISLLPARLSNCLYARGCIKPRQVRICLINLGRFPWTAEGESRRIRSQIVPDQMPGNKRIQNGSHKNIKKRDEIRVSSRFFTTKRFTARLILPFDSITYRDVHFKSVNATDFLSLKKTERLCDLDDEPTTIY
jgi:hypothetical protein